MYIGLIVLQKPWLKLNRGGESDGAEDAGVIKLDGVERWWLPFSNGLCMSPMRPVLCESAILPMWGLWSILFMLDEPLVMFALGFVSVDEFVSLAQLMSLLLTFRVLLLLLLVLLLGVDNRCVRNFSSRRHFALWLRENFLVCITEKCVYGDYANLLFENQTWILASGNPIFTAKRSLAKTLKRFR